MSTVAKKGKRKQGKRKPKCSASSAPVVTKRLLKYDAKLGCMVEVNRTTGETKPVEDSKNTDWLKPRMENCRTQNQSLYPLISNSLSFLPSQLKEVNTILERKGIRGTEFTKMGQTVFKDEKHRHDVCRALGRCDLDGGYRSPSPLRFDGKVPR